jgi:hypothetical protein
MLFLLLSSLATPEGLMANHQAQQAGLLTLPPSSTNYLPRTFSSGLLFVAIMGGLQLRDSSGFSPDSLFNHANSEPIAIAKVRLSERKTKFIWDFPNESTHSRTSFAYP